MSEPPPRAIVRWSVQRRVLSALTVPVLLGLAHWSRVTENEPSENAARIFFALALLSLAFQAHLAVWRLDTSAEGIVERRLWGTRRVAWSEIRGVELIGQVANGTTIARWRAAGPDAFHVLIHTESGYLGTHRWMSGLDDLLAVLEDRGFLGPRGATVAPEPVGTSLDSPLHQTIEKAEAGLELMHVGVIALPFSWIFGLVASLSLGFHPTSSPFVDATLLAPAPWGAAYLVYKWVSGERARRFGAAHAKPPIAFTDGVLATIGAVSGPALLYLYGSKLLGEVDKGNLLLVGMGLVFCWFPIAQIRRAIRER